MNEKSFLISALTSANVKAFLQTIRQSEGTSAPDGYNYIFGSSPENDVRFTDFSKHPNIKVPFGKTFSTAAGAYQILYPTWVDLQSKLGLPDFASHSQDLAAVELLSEKNCVQKLIDGDFTYALEQAASIWASLPNNNYGQPEHSVATVTQWFVDAGGTIV